MNNKKALEENKNKDVDFLGVAYFAWNDMQNNRG